MRTKNRFKDSWESYTLPKGRCADEFKQYLRDRGIYFEPSSDGAYVHFEVKDADESCDLEVRAIKRGCTKFKDSGEVSSMISSLQKELTTLFEEASRYEEEHYDDYLDGIISKKHYAHYMDSFGAKATAIYYLLKAYGYTPKVDSGYLGLIDTAYLENLGR